MPPRSTSSAPSIVATTETNPAPATSAQGFSVGLRLGYGVPIGNIYQDTAIDGSKTDRKLSSILNHQIPSWIDGGYRFTPNVYVGAFFSYGFATFADTNSCSRFTSCSASDINFGLNAHYHILPGQGFDPWVGVGAGYEIATLSGTGRSLTYYGFTFADFQVGGDFVVLRGLGIGPVVDFSIGQFTGCNVNYGVNDPCTIDHASLHEWLTIGIRGVYDL
ncbi:MAG: hypothetical protein NVS3B20_02710 [Polyangiales bacterium]